MSEVHKDNDHNNAWLQLNTLQITTRAGEINSWIVSCVTISFQHFHFVLILQNILEIYWSNCSKSASQMLLNLKAITLQLGGNYQPNE